MLWRATAAVSVALLGSGVVDPVSAADVAEHYSPYANAEFPRNLYWGDLHVHSERSMDANSLGNRLDPDTAYRFAKGETVVTTTGVPMKLSRPLDFLLVSDHAEFLGLFPLLRNQDRRALATGAGQGFARLFAENNRGKLLGEIMEVNFSEKLPATIEEKGLTQSPEFKLDLWKEGTAAADRHNEPGRFTAFIGYEWTSQPRGDNLHRNVVFRDGARRANQVIPFSSQDSQDPEDLWNFMEEYETKTDGRILAIPHNANGSNGLMFSDKTYTGGKLSKDYAQTRLRWEPVVEVTQIKGDGEAHPFLSPDDEFADFESWDESNMGGGIPKEEWMLEHEYARGALKLGLKLERQLGANPFKFGMIGSSDSHTSLAAVEEDNFSGKFASDEPGHRIGKSLLVAGFASKVQPKARPVQQYAAAGYAAVWARENSREALFDAIERKEIYATTGPRISVRLFGGWNFRENDDKRSDYVALGYRQGVPMGGELTGAPDGEAPTFLVLAAKDPIGANLDRVQVVKGWLDENGNSQEQVYNVALSDDRQADPETGKAPALVSTVDIASATYRNSIGSPLLSTVWTDPDFDPAVKAFYYARVIEIPTPRWSTYESALLAQSVPDDVPAVIQERVYTSPIWYSP